MVRSCRFVIPHHPLSYPLLFVFFYRSCRYLVKDHAFFLSTFSPMCNLMPCCSFCCLLPLLSQLHSTPLSCTQFTPSLETQPHVQHSFPAPPPPRIGPTTGPPVVYQSHKQHYSARVQHSRGSSHVLFYRSSRALYLPIFGLAFAWSLLLIRLRLVSCPTSVVS